MLATAPAAHAQTPLAPGEIARVAHQPILKAEYDHWLPVAKASLGRQIEPEDEADLGEQVMQLLITFRWLDLEAKRVGITVRPGTVLFAYRKQKELSFPREKDFQRFLRRTHQTEADVKRRIRLDLLANKLRDRAVGDAKTANGQSRRLERYVVRFTRLWTDRTVCGVGYDLSRSCGHSVPLST